MSLNKTLGYLTGHHTDFSLEHRIFHSFCIVAILTLIYCIPLNIALNLPVSAWLSFAGAVIQSFLFYLSRFQKKSKLSLVLSIVIIHLILITNYYFNSGLSGPSLLLMLAVFFMCAAATKPNEHKYWITLNILIAVALPLWEYFYPGTITDTYPSKASRFGDMASTYCLCAFTMLLALRYIKKNYYYAQELLETKAQDLSTLNQTKDKIFSIISHDLRAPITSIHNYLELLLSTDLNAEERLRIKGDLRDMTQNTDIMLSNLLMWSKSQMDGINPNPRLLKLREIIEPVIGLFQTIARKKEIELYYEISDDIEVTTDVEMLQMVVRNLLSNAVKFTPPGGGIDIKGSCRNDECLITVEDNGTGMSKDVQSLLFTHQTKPAFGTKNERGVGIGLNLSKEFIERLGGTIRFESQSDKGTIFYITFPRCSSPV